MQADAESTEHTPPGYPVWKIALLVVLPFAGGYFLSYLYRTVNAVISGRIIEDLPIDASDLGLLTAFYFLAFAAFQMPLGLLLDRFGPRRVQASLLLVSALGAFLFSIGVTLFELSVGRALIGFGVSGGLMASLKAITMWFPAKRWPLVNGCFLATGGLGAVAATGPVEALLSLTDWRGLFLGLAIATILVSAVIFLVVPERRDVGRSHASFSDQWKGVVTIYSSRVFWAVAPLAIAVQSVGFSIHGLWAGPWLSDVGGLDSAGVAMVLMSMALALTAGFVFTGVAADRLQSMGFTLDQLSGLGAALFIAVQILIVSGLVTSEIWPWVLFGFTSNITVLCYPRLAQAFSLEMSGRVNTSLNMMVFISAFVLQYAMGGLIELAASGGGESYPPSAYRFAFTVAIVLELASLAWFLFAVRRLSSPAPKG
ncbi:MFS transporter [Fodinicurvata halophila]|uniref:MFS transporter n=1 Tax=Fodinicurvata halophila TaxID=1419723 RepID=A0ABV8UL51_9PROT